MELWIAAAVFIAIFLFGALIFKMACFFMPKIEGQAKKLGVKTTEDFFSNIEATYIERRARLLKLKKVRISSIEAGMVIHYYVRATVIFAIGKKQYLCKRSLFSMVPTTEESLADSAAELIKTSPHIRVYYQPRNEHNSFAIINGVKSWESVPKAH